LVTLEEFIRQHLNKVENNSVLPFPIRNASLSANKTITDYGQVEDCVYFLNKGLIQVSVLKNDEEKILDFFVSGDFFCAYSSFLTQTPSDVRINTLVVCQVSVIRRIDLMQAYSTSLLANQLGLFVTQQLYLKRTQREKDFLTKSAEERYKDLMNRNPSLIQQIPLAKVAHYLGMHPESLSRIRKSIIF
jgi:CRP-like cAMP-binding protein